MLDVVGHGTGGFRLSRAEYTELLQATIRGVATKEDCLPEWAGEYFARHGIVREAWADCMSSPSRMIGTVLGSRLARQAISKKRVLTDKSGLFE